MKCANLLYGTAPVILHDHGRSKNPRLIAKKLAVFEPIRKKLLSGPARKCGPSEELTIITWNNRPQKGPLEESLDHLGIPYIVLGRQVENWSSHQLKIQLALEALPQIKTKYVLGVDSADALILDDTSIALERFKRDFRCKALFQGSPLAWPARHMVTRIAPEVVDEIDGFERKNRLTPHFRLNAGAVIAERDFYFRLLQEALGLDLLSEQMAMRMMYRRYYPEVQVDQRCHIFQSLMQGPWDLRGETVYLRRFKRVPLLVDKVFSRLVKTV